MTNYTGARCPICKKKFEVGDDIVVCPICGAPHHRDCYTELGHCAFEEEHISGKVWSPPKKTSVSTSQPPARSPQGQYPQPTPPTNNAESPPQSNKSTRTCSACNNENPSTNLFCNLCGQWLGKEQQESPPRMGNPFIMQGGDGQNRSYSPFTQYLEQQLQFDPQFALYGGLSPDDTIGDYTAHDVATYVGKSSSYYVPKLKSIGDTGKNFMFSASAFLFHGFYFLYRKMYTIGILLLIIFIVSAIPTALFVKEFVSYEEFIIDVGVDANGNPKEEYDPLAMAQLQRYSRMSEQSSWLFLVISAASSALSMRLYYDHSMKRIKKTLDNYPAEERSKGNCLLCEQALAKKGGVNIGALVAGLAITVFLLASIVTYLVVFAR